ncbi:hypothetical protein [Marinitoga sp. 38H-ov]|uniref:hypothetical protein n=1 Tax=Marinitoga sp. 38H-ov TaxID=1755814 RepID=UPI0013EAF611|nr:hypothetical protein [Marinitoga sp. 38H-ov]KAF2956609.1 hypothetical protein AS160_05275 [Marinitoga sp. 38H-ov]
MYISMVDDFFWISIFFGIAILLKRFIPALQKFIIPNSILAGFIGFLMGPNLLHLIDLDIDGLGRIIYHLMAIGFIALALRNVESKGKYGKAGFIIVSTYLFQGILGVSIASLFYLFDKTTPIPIGFIVPLGFGQGPGQAFSIGSQWQLLGLNNGSAVGLSVAAAGFGWATIGGLIILNILLAKWKKDKSKIIVHKKELVVKDYEFSDMDGLTIQFVLIGIVYSITYFLIKISTEYLNTLGSLGHTFGTVLWGFHFVFGAIIAMIFRNIYVKLREKEIAKENYINNFLLQRISGAVFDFMVAASISAVSLARIREYFWPIFFVTLFAGISTYFYVMLLTKKIIIKNEIENRIAFFGMLTGTISTAMALLREVDPALESGAAENLIFGSGISLMIGFPLIAILNLPALYLTSGKIIYNFYGLGLMIAYNFLLFLIFFRKPKNT